MSELQRLRDAMRFLTQHLPGATELAEIAEQGSVVLDSQRQEDAEKVLTGKKDKIYNQTEFQKALDEFRRRNFCNLEIGRLYERYIGYLHEIDEWRVSYTGVLGGFEDLGRDLICIRGNEHLVIQTKCWSQKKEIHEKHIYQLHSTVTHYRLQLREAMQLQRGKAKTKEFMRNLKISGKFYSTTSLSETASKVARHVAVDFKNEPLKKDYPMIKCNISKVTGEKKYHLPFDPQYDSIIIGNVDGEFYVHTVAEAEAKSFRRVGYILM